MVSLPFPEKSELIKPKRCAVRKIGQAATDLLTAEISGGIVEDRLGRDDEMDLSGRAATVFPARKVECWAAIWRLVSQIDARVLHRVNLSHSKLEKPKIGFADHGGVAELGAAIVRVSAAWVLRSSSGRRWARRMRLRIECLLFSMTFFKGSLRDASIGIKAGLTMPFAGEATPVRYPHRQMTNLNNRTYRFRTPSMPHDSHLDKVPGFVEFHLLKGPEAEDHTLYASHTIWENRAVFEAWTKSEAFRAAHSRAGENKPLYLDHPQFEGFEVRQTVGRGKTAVA